jgi:hypothetical protein
LRHALDRGRYHERRADARELQRAGDEGDERSLETFEDVAAGHYRWPIDVPSDVGGTVELSAVDPKPGDELRWAVAVNGETVDEQSEALEKPLQQGYGFFLQAYFDDYASGALD